MRNRVTCHRTVAALVGVVAVAAGCTDSTSPGSAPSSTRASSSQPAVVAATSATTAVPPPLHVLGTVRTKALTMHSYGGATYAITANGAVGAVSASGTFGTPLVRHGAVAFQVGADGVFVATGSTVERLSPKDGKVLDRHAVSSPTAIAVDGMHVFVLSAGNRSAVDRIDFSTGASASYRLPNPVKSLLQGAEPMIDLIALDATGHLWVPDGGKLLEIDARRLSLVASYALHLDPNVVTVTKYGVFVATYGSAGGIERLAPGAKRVSTCWATGDAIQMADDNGSLWASASSGLSELDERTCTVLGQATPIDGGGTGVAIKAGSVWVTYPDDSKMQIVQA